MKIYTKEELVKRYGKRSFEAYGEETLRGWAKKEDWELEVLKSSIRIGEIGNYYGGLHVSKYEDKFYWCIENHSGFHWEEIPKGLFEVLSKYKKRG